jgi:hypothetical protein
MPATPRTGSAHLAAVEPPAPAFAEKHYLPREIGELWGLGEDTVRRIFAGEPGVLVLRNDAEGCGKRNYATMRIPASVAERVHRRMSRVAR